MKTKNISTKYRELWNGIENEIETINGNKTSEFGKDFMKIEFDSDDDLPLNKQLTFSTMAAVVRSVLEEDGKYYPQVYLDKCLYEL